MPGCLAVSGTSLSRRSLQELSDTSAGSLSSETSETARVLASARPCVLRCRSVIGEFPDIFAAYYPDEVQPHSLSPLLLSGAQGLPSTRAPKEGPGCTTERTTERKSVSLRARMLGVKCASSPGNLKSHTGDFLPVPLYEAVLRQQHLQRMGVLSFCSGFAGRASLRARQGRQFRVPAEGKEVAEDSWRGEERPVASLASKTDGKATETSGGERLFVGSPGESEKPQQTSETTEATSVPQMQTPREEGQTEQGPGFASASAARCSDTQTSPQEVEPSDLAVLPPGIVPAEQGGDEADVHLHSWRGDVSLFSMLSDATGMDASALLRPLPLFQYLFKMQRNLQRRRRLLALLERRLRKTQKQRGRHLPDEKVGMPPVGSPARTRSPREGEGRNSCGSRGVAAGRGFNVCTASTAEMEKGRCDGGGEDCEKGEQVLRSWLRSGRAFSTIQDRSERAGEGDEERSCTALSVCFCANYATCTAEGLSVAYYLAQGRPSMAFHFLLVLRAATKAPQLPGPRSRPGALLHSTEGDKEVAGTLHHWQSAALDVSLLDLTEEEADALHDVALLVALHNMLNEGVVAAALCFLELCGLETERLRVDSLSARQVYLHRKGAAKGPYERAGKKSRKMRSPNWERAKDAESKKEEEPSRTETEDLGKRQRKPTPADRTSLAGDVWGEEGSEDEDRGGEEEVTPDHEAADVIELFLSFPKPTRRTSSMSSGDEEEPYGAREGQRGRRRMNRHAASGPTTEKEESSAGISSPHLLAALRMLEEATWSLDPNLATTQAAAATPLSLDSPWHLVALFCR